MKLRMLSCLLALCLLLGMIPVFAAETTAEPGTLGMDENYHTTYTVGGETYFVNLGTFSKNGTYSGKELSQCVPDETTEAMVTSFIILYNEAYEDAPREIYESFWNSCTFESYLFSPQIDGGSETCPILTDADGKFCGIAIPETNPTLTSSGTADLPVTIALTSPAKQIRIFLTRTDCTALGSSLRRTVTP